MTSSCRIGSTTLSHWRFHRYMLFELEMKFVTRLWIHSSLDDKYATYFYHLCSHNWASEASPTLGCSIEISRYIYICLGLSMGKEYKKIVC